MSETTRMMLEHDARQAARYTAWIETLRSPLDMARAVFPPVITQMIPVKWRPCL